MLIASATAGGGPYVAALSDELLRPDGTPYDNQTGISGMARAAAQVAVHVTPAFSVEVGADYAWYAGLAHSMRFRIGGSISVEELGVPLELVEVEADELYPSLANRYATRSPVTVGVYNRSRFPVRNVRITASSEGLIAGEAAAAEIDAIESGATAETSLRFPLADTAVANPSERAVQIGLAAGGVVSNRRTAPRPLGVVETALLGRNSLTWTDDRKAASFVTPTSEGALRLSREVSSVVRGIDSTLDPMLRFAMAATEAINTGMYFGATDALVVNSLVDAGLVENQSLGIVAEGGSLVVRTSTIGVSNSGFGSAIQVTAIDSVPVPTTVQNTILAATGGSGSGYLIDTDSIATTTLQNSNLSGPATSSYRATSGSSRRRSPMRAEPRIPTTTSIPPSPTRSGSSTEATGG